MARQQTLEIRVSTAEKAAIRAAAEQDHRLVSDWARLTLLTAAKRQAELTTVAGKKS